MFTPHKTHRSIISWSPILQPARRWHSGSELASLHRFQRAEKLKEIYKPFDKLKKGSSEFQELANSGMVWEDYFQPGDSKKLGYLALQQELMDTLERIDNLKRGRSILVDAMAKTLAAECAHQSVQIEGNQVDLGDSVLMDDTLTEKIFQHIDLGNLNAEALLSLDTLDISSKSYDSEQVAELRNHIIISRWISEVGSRNPGTVGLSEREICTLSAITLKNTGSEAIYAYGWGKRLSLGDYRATPISVKSNHLWIFPYNVEVPALIKRFFIWRDEVHKRKELHPLIMACQMIAYFLHIHPFPDGNGRIGRMLMHDYMVRQGYLPIVMVNLNRREYLQIISDAQDGKPRNFVPRILEAQLDELLTCTWRS